MGIMSAISNLLRALASYWSLKEKRYYHDLIAQSRATVYALTEEMEALRDAGDNANSQHADRLRERIVDEKSHLKHLSAGRFTS